MRLYFQKAAQRLLHKPFEKLPAQERNVIEHIVTQQPISRDLERDFEAQTTVGQHLADRVAACGGSWAFIILFGCTLCAWILLNSFVLARRGLEFDPYPYILLNLALSMLAAIQAPVILMSQNRQAAKDRLEAAHDYEVNLKAEIEIQTLKETVDHIADVHIAAIMTMLHEQRRLLVQYCTPEVAARHGVQTSVGEEHATPPPPAQDGDGVCECLVACLSAQDPPA